MAKSKIGLEFSGFDEMIERLDKADGDIKGAVEECLTAAEQTVAGKLHSDMKRHHRSGRTEKAIIDDAQVKWEGTTASISVGFDLKNGGLPSVFLMYGTPRMPKDQKVYNDVYGSATKKEVAKLQEEAVKRRLTEALGGG